LNSPHYYSHYKSQPCLHSDNTTALLVTAYLIPRITLNQIFQCLEMARLSVSLILILVAAATITTAHGGRALDTERSMAEPPSSMAWDMTALRSLFPRVQTANGPATSYYNGADLEYKVPVTGF
jgi:hypothetical protein